jgi:hypothetical protein
VRSALIFATILILPLAPIKSFTDEAFARGIIDFSRQEIIPALTGACYNGDFRISKDRMSCLEEIQKMTKLTRPVRENQSAVKPSRLGPCLDDLKTPNKSLPEVIFTGTVDKATSATARALLGSTEFSDIWSKALKLSEKPSSTEHFASFADLLQALNYHRRALNGDPQQEMVKIKNLIAKKFGVHLNEDIIYQEMVNFRLQKYPKKWKKIFLEFANHLSIRQRADLLTRWHQLPSRIQVGNESWKDLITQGAQSLKLRPVEDISLNPDNRIWLEDTSTGERIWISSTPMPVVNLKEARIIDEDSGMSYSISTYNPTDSNTNELPKIAIVSEPTKKITDILPQVDLKFVPPDSSFSAVLTSKIGGLDKPFAKASPKENEADEFDSARDNGREAESPKFDPAKIRSETSLTVKGKSTQVDLTSKVNPLGETSNSAGIKRKHKLGDKLNLEASAKTRFEEDNNMQEWATSATLKPGVLNSSIVFGISNHSEVDLNETSRRVMVKLPFSKQFSTNLSYSTQDTTRNSSGAKNSEEAETQKREIEVIAGAKKQVKLSVTQEREISDDTSGKYRSDDRMLVDESLVGALEIAGTMELSYESSRDGNDEQKKMKLEAKAKDLAGTITYTSEDDPTTRIPAEQSIEGSLKINSQGAALAVVVGASLSDQEKKVELRRKGRRTGSLETRLTYEMSEENGASLMLGIGRGF